MLQTHGSVGGLSRRRQNQGGVHDRLHKIQGQVHHVEHVRGQRLQFI